jgi:hypothetical protein
LLQILNDIILRGNRSKTTRTKERRSRTNSSSQSRNASRNSKKNRDRSASTNSEDFYTGTVDIPGKGPNIPTCQYLEKFSAYGSTQKWSASIYWKNLFTVQLIFSELVHIHRLESLTVDTRVYLLAIGPTHLPTLRISTQVDLLRISLHL